VPNLVVSAPMNEQELRNLMFTAQLPNQGPFSIRYPRGQGVMSDWEKSFEAIEIGKGRKVEDGEEIAILSIGHIGNYVGEAKNILSTKGINPAHYDLRFVKPLDENLLHEVFNNYSLILTIEDGCLPGGFGGAILEFMAEQGYSAKVKRLGIPDRIVEHGEQSELHKECGFDPEGIANACIEMVESNVVVKKIF